jgi:coenzyme F420-reducing hydrogenase delta subunit/Pyruvate/2-oxoacid:ferredoxin oxidoreductase delta subunit
MKAPPLESFFLVPPPPPESRDFRRTLVAGGDDAGRELAEALAGEGLEVILVDQSRAALAIPGVAVVPGSALTHVHGFVGAFECGVSAPDGQRTEWAGFVVAAAPAERIPKFADYGLNPSDRVMSLTALEKALKNGDDLPPGKGPWFHALFLCGLAGEWRAESFARVFDAIGGLQSRGSVQCYVFCRQVGVAAAGAERRYREVREKGTLFFKFDGRGPRFDQTAGGLVAVFREPLLGVEMELAPDLTVVDEHLLPHGSLQPFRDLLSASFAFPFARPDSPRFSGAETSKQGILVVGPSRGNFDSQTVRADIDAAVVAVKAASAAPDGRPNPAAPIIDQAKCATCLTCLRLCPHGAISFQKRAFVDPLSCFRCGICAAECPAGAITVPPAPGEADLPVRIASALSAAQGPIRIAAFLCSRSAAHALDAARPWISRNIAPIIVQCAGAVSVEHILDVFVRGAHGVLVAGCHEGNCGSVYGTHLASERTSSAAAILEEAGIDPAALHFIGAASNAAADFRRAIAEFEERIRRLKQL